MKQPTTPGTAGHASVPAGRSRVWLLGLFALLAWQVWLTLGLFDPGRSCRRLLDDQPVVSGRHPLHLYHGYLGASSFCERGSLSCYDPAFHAGYPKTPVFDSGSRPAELALALAGAHYSPAAYKIGLAAVCLLVPGALYLAARGAGLCRGIAVLATALGMCLFWSRPGREALEGGDIDLLLATVLLLAHAGLLVRYHQIPGVLSLSGVVLTGLLAWFAHLALALLALPLFLIYYLTVGHRHRLTWHLPLFGGLSLGIAANAFWLHDLFQHWWIRVPPSRDTPLVAQRNLQTWWAAPLWGEGLDKAFACLLVLLGGVGVVLLHRGGLRTTARLLGLGVAGFLALALAGISWEPFARLGSCHLLAPALLFATLPAALAIARGLDLVRRATGTLASPTLLVAAFPVLLALTAPGPAGAWGRHLVHPRPLEIGLGEGRTALVEALRAETSKDARILWEDRRTARTESHWPALLPLLTGRAFVGGLDAEAGIEHAVTGLLDRTLAGRPIDAWSDTELEVYCRKYNLGWIVCWSEEARARFRRWPAATEGRTLPALPEGRPTLFALRRQPSFALAGSVTWNSADARAILLSDATPQRIANEAEGQVVLSLHYQAGMRVRPARVRLEQAMDSQDTIPFVRLRMSEPVGRILITWEGGR